MEAEPVWDCHVHNWHGFGEVAALRAHLQRYGIRRINLLGPLLGGFSPTPAEVEACNARTRAFRDALPEQVAAYCYLNPAHPRHAVAEWRRCREAGFAGVKLWVALRCHEAGVDAIVHEAVEAEVPILIHVWTKATGNLPGESTPDDFAALAARHPAGRFIMAHIGGRYEQGLAAIGGLRNVWLDYAGGANEAGAYERALEVVGPTRLLFGTDGPCSYLACRGRVLEAVADAATRRLIFHDNMAALAAGTFLP